MIIGGYNDWYLPSWQELFVLYNNNFAGLDSNAVYWTSSYDGLYSNNSAVGLGGGNGLSGTFYTRNSIRKVRAVRNF